MIGNSIGVENCYTPVSSSSPYLKLSRMPVPVRSLIQQDKRECAEHAHFAADLLTTARRAHKRCCFARRGRGWRRRGFAENRNQSSSLL